MATRARTGRKRRPARRQAVGHSPRFKGWVEEASSDAARKLKRRSPWPPLPEAQPISPRPKAAAEQAPKCHLCGRFIPDHGQHECRETAVPGRSERENERVWPRYVTPEEFKTIFKVEPEELFDSEWVVKLRRKARDYMICLLAYVAGLRLSEVCTLKVSQFKAIKTDKHGNKVPEYALIEICGKGGKFRVVPLGHRWWLLVKRYVQKEHVRRGEWLFHARRHQLPISPRRVQAVFKAYVKQSGIKTFSCGYDWPKINFHSLRHSYGVNLTQAEIPTATVQQLMGHSNITTTQIYTDMRPMEAARAVRDIDVFAGVGAGTGAGEADGKEEKKEEVT